MRAKYPEAQTSKISKNRIRKYPEVDGRDDVGFGLETCMYHRAKKFATAQNIK